VGIQND